MTRAWQRMLSGRRLDILNPSALDIEIEDIAHGLARVARWNGQTRGDYIFSVAQHSLLVEHLVARSEVAGPHEKMFALLHDAPEYVIGDMISPFKVAIGESYKEVEANLLHAILIRFGLSTSPPAMLLKIVKAADRAAAFFEATHLAGFSFDEARTIFGTPDWRPHKLEDLLAPRPSIEAERLFLEKFRALEQKI